VVVTLVGLLWNSNSNGGLVRLLGGVTADELSMVSPKQAGGAVAPKWTNVASKDGYNLSCDYRFHLIISKIQATKISLDLSRYAGEAVFYPTIVNDHFLQALILESGEAISVDIRNNSGGDGCEPGQASLSDLPGMCFDTKIEQRC